MKWWKAIEEHVAEREQGAPDPWGDLALGDATLTEAQEDFLAGLDDQPRPPRIAQPERFGADVTPPHHQGDDPGGQHDETGNSPGDSTIPPGVPSDP